VPPIPFRAACATGGPFSCGSRLRLAAQHAIKRCSRDEPTPSKSQRWYLAASNEVVCLIAANSQPRCYVLQRHHISCSPFRLEALSPLGLFLPVHLDVLD
jgi:hypothetical protein